MKAKKAKVDYSYIKRYKSGAQAIDFLEKCLAKQPSKRCTAAQLLDHPWITSLSKSDEISETELVEAGMNIYSFKQASLFQSSVIAMLAGMKQSKEEISALRKVFVLLDEDQDGYLSREEIIQGMQQVDSGLSSIWGKNPDWDTVISSIDTNRDGVIDYDEFMTAAADREKLLNTKNLKNAFRALDKNGNGKIEVEEIKGAFSYGNIDNLSFHGVNVNESFWTKLMSELDKN